MDSWTLQGDSYSFLRGAPRNFSLCHRDGTPNHVEIFDIINVPTQRSAISETTCLCDIFGDDGESQSLSSSPAVGPFVPARRDLEETAAVSSPTVDDQNDSSGSYHTAPGSSEGEEGPEDSREGFYSPTSQSEYSETRSPEGKELALRHPKAPEDSSPNLEPKSPLHTPGPSTARLTPEVLGSDQRTLSPGLNSPDTLSTEGRLSSPSSFSFEKRRSPLSSDSQQTDSETEASTRTPSFKDRHSSTSHQSFTPSPSFNPRERVHSSSSESVRTQNLPEPGACSVSQSSSPSSELTSEDFIESNSESRTIHSSPLPSPSGSELFSHSRENLASPELRNTPSFSDTQTSSPFPELRGRVSLPDLLSRGSTPDIEDFDHTPEIVSAPCTPTRNSTASPGSQNKRFSLEPGSTSSTPRLTPPSPAISITTLPELVESPTSLEFRNTGQTDPSSPFLLSAASPTKAHSRTPSRDPSPHLPYSEIKPQTSSPAISYSLSPSPGIRENCSPTEYRYTSPSPEIRITASSPEVNRKERSPEAEETASFFSPLPEPLCTPPRSHSSSPQITGICCSIVQPEDRYSPPFPELSCLPSPEPDRPRMSSEAGSRNSVGSSVPESTGTPRGSPHTSDLPRPVSQSELTQFRYQTPSPHLNYQTLSPEPRNQTLSPDKYQSPSLQNKSRDPSPVASSSGHSHLQSPATLSTEYNPLYTQPVPCTENTPEVQRDSPLVDITDARSPTHLAEDSVSPSLGVYTGDSLAATEVKHGSPVAAFQSPVSISPVLIEEKRSISSKQEGPERGETPNKVSVKNQSSRSFVPEGKQSISAHFSQSEEPYKNPDLILCKSRPPVRRAASSSPVQTLEIPQSNSFALPSGNRNAIKPFCTPENSRRQLLPKVRRENREGSAEDMSRHVSRRRTPSPPLTRFTPVHIIAPEKPYRHWQKNRSHSPSQVVTSSPSGNVKKAVTNRESPDMAPVDNNSQTPWVRPGWQPEREMQLEQERGIGRERKKERELKKEREREERVPEKGEGWQGDASYRGEQVELSFSARNRKGPASRAAAPTSRETRQGLPTVHSYPEGSLATRQLQQQQSLLRLASQQDARGGGGVASRRQPPPPAAPHTKTSAPGRVAAANRPCRSSSSSMGSELDEADNEVKWFTDVAFRSLSSPEVDYLDMYNSSHRSSTNVSQPSTQESPAGANVAWLAYADFRGSAPKLNQDELPFQQPSAYYSDGLDPLRRSELGSFECVDVAVEREDSRKARRGVPKRQIQLKRRDSADGKQDESSENSSPGPPVMVESPSQEAQTRGALVRQHSTPAAMQEYYPSESSPDPPQQNERKSKLQKSASVDETCSKTKMATCLIKSVLSKKMQSVDKPPDEPLGEEISPTFEENSPLTETAVAPPKVSQKHPSNLISTHQSDYSLSSEALPVRGEHNTKEDAKPPKGKPSHRPTSSSSSSSRSVNFSRTDSEEADSQSTPAASIRAEMRSELKVPLDSKQSGVQRADDSKTCKSQAGDSAHASVGNTGAPCGTGARITQTRETNRDQECENTEDHKQRQPGHKGGCLSKTQEITIKAVEKKKASLNVCLTPEAENKPETSLSEFSSSEKEDGAGEKTKEEENENLNVKAPIHKVRDVRRLVKNTYNLSFKAPSAVTPTEEETEIPNEELRDFEKNLRRDTRSVERKEEKEEEFIMESKKEHKEGVKDLRGFPSPLQVKGKSLSGSQPMQIECKAVCWKEDKNKMSGIYKDPENQDDLPQASLHTPTEVTREPQALHSQNVATPGHNVNITAGTQETTTEIHKVLNSEEKTVVVKTDRKPPMLGGLPKPPSKEREVSTAVVLIREGSHKARTSPSPAQDEVPTPIRAPVPSISPEPVSPGGHSVSMLLKEKGYQADIGAVVGDNQSAAGTKGVPRKHVNCLEIPLQTVTASDGGSTDAFRERTSSLTSSASGPPAGTDHTDNLTKTTEEEEEEEVNGKAPAEKDTPKQKSFSPLKNTQERTLPPIKQKDLGDFESVKRLDPTFPPRSPAIRRFKPQPIEVKSVSKEPPKKEIPVNPMGTNRPQTIEVKSIAKNSQKPAVPPKPNCKFKPADLGAMPNDAQRPSATTSAVKLQSEERPQTIVVSSPTIYRKIPSDSTSMSNYSKKLAVSAISSLKPPSNKPTNAEPSNQSAATSDVEAPNGRGQQQRTTGPTQNHAHLTPVTLATAPTSTTGSGGSWASAPVPDPKPSHISGPDLTGGSSSSQPSQPAVADPDNQLRYPRPAYPHEQAPPATSNGAKQPSAVSTTQLPRYSHQSFRRSLSSERSHRTDDLRFYASDDPPSYDERESFSPLMLPDLTPLRSNRYQPSSARPAPCSCTAGCPSHPGLTPPHHHRSPHNLTPPAAPHSPGQAAPYPVVQPSLRPHQCRPEPPPMSYQPGSPKSSPLGPNLPPALYQPLHQAAPCPPHPSFMQTCPADRPMQPPQHIDPRRPPVHRSPHQPPHGMSGAPYGDSGHGHSPGLPTMDPQYLCGPQSMGPSYGSEYGGDSSSLYSESSYAQTPRRVLLDPETGKYFYIEVPVQPLRKMLFDPETGQYVEVLIPQQAVSHSGLYPPSAVPYPPLPNPNIYAPAPQYMPYAAPPPPPAHPQPQPQPPRYPEASATATMHQSGPGVSYRNPSSQGSKPEPQAHPPLDHSYLESMYYVPTGMNASPNPTPPDYYHKHLPNLPPTGGKRS